MHHHNDRMLCALMSAVTGLFSHLLRFPFDSQQQPHVAEDKDDTEEDEVAGHTQQCR